MLCVLSTKYGGDPCPVEYMISGCQYDPYPDAELAVHQAGIQVGYSSLVHMAIEKANEYRSLPQTGEIETGKLFCPPLIRLTSMKYETL